MRTLALLALVLLAAGCSLGEDEGASIEEAQLKTLVLQPEDLGREFLRFDEGRQGIADSPGGRRSERDRFGRLDGWKARYRRPGSRETKGPLVVESRADVFESAGGAAEELAAIAEGGFDSIESPTLGDEVRAWQSVQGGGGTGVRYYLIAWREDNATASVLASGFAGKITFEDALGLARKQAGRTSAAAER